MRTIPLTVLLGLVTIPWTLSAREASVMFPPRLTDGAYPRHYRPDRTVDTKTIRLDIRLDFDKQSIDGVVHHTVVPIHEEIDRIRLDSAGLSIVEILLDGDAALEYDLIPKDEELIVYLPEGTGRRNEFTVSVRYRGTPRERFYWRDTRSSAEVRNADMAFTLCEPTGAALWFPCLDYPSDRARTEMNVTVPKGFVTISNGALVSETESADGEWVTHHWSMKHDHVTYLVSLVAGRYGVARDLWRGIPVEYYCMPGKEEDARASMGMTPKMLDFYSELFGVDYPYEKYAQVPVKDFPAGGMEHTTCTTMYEYLVLSERARIDDDEESLIAHELVHQWFGDLLTCESWPHLWLNEGFATYFEKLWWEREHSREDFLRRMWDNANSYFGEAERYTRALVTNQFSSSREMFDRHSYPKAGWVLHMLRDELGDPLFERTIQEYCRKHQHGLVDTDDFQEVIEAATGRSMDRFFEQWVYRPGHPKLKVEWSWHGQEKEVRLTCRQTQKMEKGAQPFRISLQVRIVAKGETVEKTVRLDRLEQTFQIACPDEPRSLDVNPDLTQLLELEFEKSKAMLIYEAQHGPSVVTRRRAVEALAKHKTNDALDALDRALSEEPYWWVQAAAANTLGKIKTRRAKELLLAAVKHPEPKVRLAVAVALGGFRKDEAVCDALTRMLEKDVSLFVASEAAVSLGKVGLKQAERTLRRALKQDSYRELLRTSSLRALAKLGDGGLVSTFTRYAEEGTTRNVRTTAMESLGAVGKDLDEKAQEEVLETLVAFLTEEDTHVRRAVAAALAELGSEDGIPHLQPFAEDLSDPRLQQAAESAIAAIRGGDRELAKKNAKRIDKLLDAQEKLERSIEELTRAVEKGE